MSVLLKMAFEESCPDIELNRVSDASKALALLRRNSGSPRPTLIMADISMPAIDGFEFLQQLKQDEWTRDIPVVIFTASARRSDRQRCLDMGAEAFLLKGNSFEEILDVIQDVCKMAEAKAA